MSSDSRDEIDDLLGHLKATLRIVPSETFETRVRARVAMERGVPSWPLVAVGAATVAVAVLAVLALHLSRNPRAPSISVEAVAMPAAQAASPVSTAARASEPVRAHVSRPRTVQAVVPVGETAALMEFAAGVQSGRIRFDVPAKNEQNTLEIPPLAALEPIDRDPIVIPALVD